MMIRLRRDWEFQPGEVIPAGAIGRRVVFDEPGFKMDVVRFEDGDGVIVHQCAYYDWSMVEQLAEFDILTTEGG